MFLEWENNSGKLQIISGKFQNNAINDVKQIHWAMWLLLIIAINIEVMSRVGAHPMKLLEGGSKCREGIQPQWKLMAKFNQLSWSQ